MYCLIPLFIYLGEDAIDSKVNNDEETLTVTLNKPLEAGTKAVFSCKFSGELNDKMRGFYRYVNNIVFSTYQVDTMQTYNYNYLY